MNEAGVRRHTIGKKSQSLCPVSALDAIFVEVPHDDAQLQLHGAHGLRVQPVSVRPAVDQVRAAELRTPAHKHLRQLLLPGAERPPGHAVDAVVSAAGRDVAVAVPEQLAPSKRVLVPHLEMDLGPPLEALSRVVEVDRVAPVRRVPRLGDIDLGLALLKPREEAPCSTRMNSPFAEQAGLRETAAPDDLADNMQLGHDSKVPLRKKQGLPIAPFRCAAASNRPSPW